MARPRLLWWKLFAVWAAFLLLHFAYDVFPGLLFRVLGAEREVTFLHMKELFVAYVLVSVVELLVRRRNLPSVSKFVWSRALIAVVYPWLTITMWFAAEALRIDLPTIPIVILYANVMTILGIYLALRLEEVLGEIEFRPAMKGLIALVFIAAVASYVSFSLKAPMPFFTPPPGWEALA